MKVHNRVNTKVRNEYYLFTSKLITQNYQPFNIDFDIPLNKCLLYYLSQRSPQLALATRRLSQGFSASFRSALQERLPQGFWWTLAQSSHDDSQGPRPVLTQHTKSDSTRVLQQSTCSVLPRRLPGSTAGAHTAHQERQYQGSPAV